MSGLLPSDIIFNRWGNLNKRVLLAKGDLFVFWVKLCGIAIWLKITVAIFNPIIFRLFLFAYIHSVFAWIKYK